MLLTYKLTKKFIDIIDIPTYASGCKIYSNITVVHPLGFIEVSFTQNLYVVPNPPMNSSCVGEEYSPPLPPAIQLQLNKPASVTIPVNITVKGEDTQCKLFSCSISL